MRNVIGGIAVIECFNPMERCRLIGAPENAPRSDPDGIKLGGKVISQGRSASSAAPPRFGQESGYE